MKLEELFRKIEERRKMFFAGSLKYRCNGCGGHTACYDCPPFSAGEVMICFIIRSIIDSNKFEEFLQGLDKECIQWDSDELISIIRTLWNVYNKKDLFCKGIKGHTYCPECLYKEV